MFIAAFFTVVTKQKESRCPSTGTWKMKMWYVHTMRYYPAVKKSEIFEFLGKWNELKTIFQIGVTKILKDKYHMFLSLLGASFELSDVCPFF